MQTVILLLLAHGLAGAAWSAQWLLVRDTSGNTIEAQTAAVSVRVNHQDKAVDLRLDQLLSLHNAAPASEAEAARIAAGIPIILSDDRKARDRAVEELTAIGLPAITPLLKAYKDTDQHEPRPLYRLFERVIPSRADGFDRTLSLARMRNGDLLRVRIAAESLDVTTAGGEKKTLAWATIRSIAVRQTSVQKVIAVHSLRHCMQIEYLDTGLVLSGTSKVDASTEGFVRMSWDTDSWASDSNGIQKPGGPTYKSNLFEGHPFGSLIGRVTSSGEPFFLGKKFSKAGLAAGRLQLAVNDNRHWQNNIGTFTTTMTVTNAYDLGDAQ
ncbi:MAG: hypothetical protein HY820_13850 [Acidobacteria bacterium]|nr:hypothetical protein [Acidobacteriota bacterium]